MYRTSSAVKRLGSYEQSEVKIRSSLRYVSWKDKKAVAKDLKTIYTANTQEGVQKALEEFNDIWGKKYPHIFQSWSNNWTELSTFFEYPQAVKSLIYTTNPIESFLCLHSL